MLFTSSFFTVYFFGSCVLMLNKIDILFLDYVYQSSVILDDMNLNDILDLTRFDVRSNVVYCWASVQFSNNKCDKINKFYPMDVKIFLVQIRHYLFLR